MSEPHVDLSPRNWDEVKQTTCYMCACRCGIKVYLKDGTVRYIEGNRNHPINKGVLCGKGSAGIMQHYSPARLTKPLIRVGERGSGEFREIEWEEALRTATMWLSEVRHTNPRKLAFFTGRDQKSVANRLVGNSVRHTQLRCPRRILLRQHGRRGPLHYRWRFLGVRRARLGVHQVLHAVRGCRGTRLQSNEKGAWRAQDPWRQIRFDQPSQNWLLSHSR